MRFLREVIDVYYAKELFALRMMCLWSMFVVQMKLERVGKCEKARRVAKCEKATRVNKAVKARV